MDNIYNIGIANEQNSYKKITKNIDTAQQFSTKPFSKSNRFVPISNSIIEYIIRNKELSSSEKLFYLFTDFYSLFLNSWKKTNPSFSAKKAATLLGFSKTKVFAIQKKLEQMDYLIIKRSFDQFGKNNVNILIPSLPEQSFFNLIKRINPKLAMTQLPPEQRRELIQQESLFIPCDLSIFRNLFFDRDLSDSSKIIFFQLFSLIHKIKFKHNFDIYAATLQIKQIILDSGFSRSTIDRSLKALEEKKFIKRKKIRIGSDCSSSNKFDKFVDYFEILTLSDDVDSNININCDKKFDNDYLKTNSSATSDPGFITDGPSYTYKNKLEKNNNRSNKSNFKFLRNINNQKLLQAKNHLIDFYPLKQTDCNKLQLLSGRKFNLNAMNEILKNMANKLTNKFFYNKESFFSYMSKALSFELRNENEINNETFRIKANFTQEEKNTYEQERFLTKLESSLQISPEWHYKKRLAAVLSREKAYEILSNYKYIRRVGECLEIHVSKEINTSIGIDKILLENAQSIFNKISKDGAFQHINQVKIINKNSIEQEKFKQKNNEKLKHEKLKPPSLLTKNSETMTIWEKIRKKYIEKSDNQEQALRIDSFLFSSIEIKEQKKDLLLYLKSPFYRDYIKENYFHILRQLSQELGYKIWLKYSFN